MTENYYYQRTDQYKPVLNRENLGCFSVPMVHSCVLVDLRRTESDYLTYVPRKLDRYDGPDDDIITFAISANLSGIPLNICNEESFGYLLTPLEPSDQLSVDFEQMINIKLEALNDQQRLYVNPILRQFVRPLPQKDTLGFEKIFMINLARRPERRRRMQACFDELGLDVSVMDAVDGK